MSEKNVVRLEDRVDDHMAAVDCALQCEKRRIANAVRKLGNDGDDGDGWTIRIRHGVWAIKQREDDVIIAGDVYGGGPETEVFFTPSDTTIDWDGHFGSHVYSNPAHSMDDLRACYKAFKEACE